jgi:hypothetical protein
MQGNPTWNSIQFWGKFEKEHQGAFPVQVRFVIANDNNK